MVFQRILYFTKSQLIYSILEEIFKKLKIPFHIDVFSEYKENFELYRIVLVDLDDFLEPISYIERLRREFPNAYILGVTKDPENIGMDAIEKGADDCVVNTPRQIFRLEHLLSRFQKQMPRTRKGSEILTAQPEQMLQLVLDNIPQAIYWKDRNLVYIGCNSNFAVDAGFQNPEDIIGKTDDQLNWNPDALNFQKRSDQCVMETGNPQCHIMEPRQKGSRTVWLDTSKIPLYDFTGKVIGVLGIYQDVTEQMNAQESLRKSEQKFRSLVETSSDLIWEMNKGSICTYVSPKIKDLLGYTPKQVLGKSAFRSIPSEEAYIMAETFLKILSYGRPFVGIETNNIRKDGKKIVLESNGTPIYDADGNLQGFRGVSRDVTERKQTQKLYMRLVEAIQQTAEGVVITDLEGNIEYINPAFEEITGYSSEEVMGLNIRLLESGKHTKRIHPKYMG